MEKLRSLLELYGCLDRVVLQSDDPAMAAAVDQLLPGSSANKGWYREIEHFCYGRHRGGARDDDPDPIRALNTIANHGHNLKAYEKLRLLYGVAAIARVQSVPAIGPLPYLKEDQNMKDAVARALAYLGPANVSHETTKASIDEIVGHLETTTGRRNWRKVTQEMVAKKWIAREVADEPLCRTALVSVNGVESVVIDTNFTSKTLSLDDVKAIADPRNWSEDDHEFFADIKALPPRSDRWGRFLETVDFGTEALQLVTELKYYKTSPNSTAAILDYDLNDPWPGAGDGLVTVDRGFIDMRAAGNTTQQNATQQGVEVRTRKVVHITGLSPAAQARLVCITGYGTASKEFLLGAAKKPPSNAVPWDDPVGGKDTAEQGDAEPAEPTSYIASAAFKVWNDCVQDVMTRNLDISEKWLDGALNLSDLAGYSKDVGGLLLRAPWEFLEAINQPRYPLGQPNNTRQRGTT
jgi:hypothetical protein